MTQRMLSPARLPGYREKLKQHEEIINELQRRVRKVTARAVVGIGEELIKARNKLEKYGEGSFNRWCQERLSISRASAYKAIAAFLTFGDCPHVDRFQPSALYELSKNSTPRRAIDEAMSLAKTDRIITHQAALRLIRWAYELVAIDSTADEDKDEDPPHKPKVKPLPSQLERLKKLWEHTSTRDRQDFREWIDQRLVRTELNAEDGRRRVISR